MDYARSIEEIYDIREAAGLYPDKGEIDTQVKKINALRAELGLDPMPEALTTPALEETGVTDTVKEEEGVIQTDETAFESFIEDLKDTAMEIRAQQQAPAPDESALSIFTRLLVRMCDSHQLKKHLVSAILTDSEGFYGQIINAFEILGEDKDLERIEYIDTIHNDRVIIERNID